jgi:hypothetical protein
MVSESSYKYVKLDDIIDLALIIHNRRTQENYTFRSTGWESRQPSIQEIVSETLYHVFIPGIRGGSRIPSPKDELPEDIRYISLSDIALLCMIRGFLDRAPGTRGRV